MLQGMRVPSSGLLSLLEVSVPIILFFIFFLQFLIMNYNIMDNCLHRLDLTYLLDTICDFQE